MMAATLPHFVDDANMRIVQGRGGARFTEDFFFHLTGALRIRLKDFECDIAMQAFVASPIDLTHTASSELFYDSVVGDDLAD